MGPDDGLKRVAVAVARALAPTVARVMLREACTVVDDEQADGADDVVVRVLPHGLGRVVRPDRVCARRVLPARVGLPCPNVLT